MVHMDGGDHTSSQLWVDRRTMAYGERASKRDSLRLDPQERL